MRHNRMPVILGSVGQQFFALLTIIGRQSGRYLPIADLNLSVNIAKNINSRTLFRRLYSEASEISSCNDHLYS